MVHKYKLKNYKKNMFQSIVLQFFEYIYVQSLLCRVESERSMINRSRRFEENLNTLIECDWNSTFIKYFNILNNIDNNDKYSDLLKADFSMNRFLMYIHQQSSPSNVSIELKRIDETNKFHTNVFVLLSDPLRSVSRISTNCISRVVPYNPYKNDEDIIFIDDWLIGGKSERLDYRRETEILVYELFADSPILGKIEIHCRHVEIDPNDELSDIKTGILDVYGEKNISVVKSTSHYFPRPSRYVSFLTHLCPYSKQNVKRTKFVKLDNPFDILRVLCERLANGDNFCIYFRQRKVPLKNIYIPYSIKFYEDVDIVFNCHFKHRIVEFDKPKLSKYNILYKQSNNYLIESSSGLDFKLIHSYVEIQKIILTDFVFSRKDDLVFIKYHTDENYLVLRSTPFENNLFEDSVFVDEKNLTVKLLLDNESIMSVLRKFIVSLQAIKSIDVHLTFYSTPFRKIVKRIDISISSTYDTNKKIIYELFPLYRFRLFDKRAGFSVDETAAAGSISETTEESGVEETAVSSDLIFSIDDILLMTDVLGSSCCSSSSNTVLSNKGSSSFRDVVTTPSPLPVEKLSIKLFK